MKNITLIIMILLISCSTKDNEKDIKRHKDLIHYKSPFLAELGDENYDKLSTKIKKDKINIDYFKDIIYVDYLTSVNACGKYFGNIEISNDTIFLIHFLDSDEICTSVGIENPTYIINNPEKKKFKIIRKND